MVATGPLPRLTPLTLTMSILGHLRPTRITSPAKTSAIAFAALQDRPSPVCAIITYSYASI